MADINYESGSDLLTCIDGLSAVWSEKASVRTAFGNKQAFLDANIESLRSLAVSTGKNFRELFYSADFVVTESP